MTSLSAYLGLHVRPNLRPTQFRIDPLVPLDERDAQVRGYHPSTRFDRHVSAFRHVVNVHGNGRVCTDAVLFHEANEVSL